VVIVGQLHLATKAKVSGNSEKTAAKNLGLHDHKGDTKRQWFKAVQNEVASWYQVNDCSNTDHSAFARGVLLTGSALHTCW
jgi:hypothetical protein